MKGRICRTVLMNKFGISLASFYTCDEHGCLVVDKVARQAGKRIQFTSAAPVILIALGSVPFPTLPHYLPAKQLNEPKLLTTLAFLRYITKSRTLVFGPLQFRRLSSIAVCTITDH